MRNKFLIILTLLFVIVSCSRKRISTPILILATNEGYGTYTAEILKAEGLNEYYIDSLSNPSVNLKYLQNFDMVILGKTSITKSQKAMFAEYVKEGGNLIALVPDKQLNELFGISYIEGTVSEGYIKLMPNDVHSVGITTNVMQFHGTALKSRLHEGKVIARLFTSKNSSDGFPALVFNNFGEGQAIAFLYNLPQSIVYTRQGNPRFAGIEKDGIFGLRGMDLFTDGWVDTTMNTINQADQQMSLLTNCIRNLSSKPLPRMWYFPDSLESLVVLDNDGEDNDESDFESQFRDIDSMGAKMTIYIKEVDKVSKEWVDRWTEEGFEIAGHPDDTRNANNPTWNTMDSALAQKVQQLKTKFGLEIQTNVNHWFVWCGNDKNGDQDFGAQARLEAMHRIEMDGNYAHYDINSNQVPHYLGTPGINQGNFTGSGLVMKYADANGRTVNVYQRFNSVYDQQYMETKNPEGFFNCFKGLVDRSLNDQIYSIVSVKAHNSMYHFSKEPLMRMLAYANKKNVPVWTSLNLLNFLKMKDEATFVNFNWSNDRLSFTLISSLKHNNGLTFMVPAMFGDKKISNITKNGEEVNYSFRKNKGVNYAFITVQGGSNYDFLVTYI